MKPHPKNIIIALVAVLCVGGGFVLAQSVPAAGSARGLAPLPSLRGNAPTARGGVGELRQPRMRDALLQLDSARTALRSALPDKGGNREKALKSVEQAINDVQAGIDYARDHPEEFPNTGPGARGASAPAGTS
ncbi:MAG TPA: hypothetical protein VK737_03820 [Opitutales bacterium]|jgi:hypothetical protein|nr:hypothetical protein [Opitutales bacterium]